MIYAGVLSMKKVISVLTLTALLHASVAWADEDCLVPMTEWQPREAVARLAVENGWTVRRIKIDDGCYEIVGTDTAGRRIEVKIHPGTLAVIEMEYEDDDDEHENKGGHDLKQDDD
jgi:hypothetical protein